MNDEKWYMEGELGELYRKALASMQDNNKSVDINLNKSNIDSNRDLSDWEMENGIQIYEDNGEFVLNSFDTNIKTDDKDSQNESPKKVERKSKKRNHKERSSNSSSNCHSEKLKNHKRKRRKQSQRSMISVSGDEARIRNKQSDRSPEIHSYRRCDREKPPERSAEYIKSLIKRREQY